MAPSSTPDQKRLYILDCDLSHWDSRHGRIISCLADGSDQQDLVTNLHEFPDGIAIDHARGHLYWTNMGTSGFSAADGSIQRCDLSTGANVTTIIPARTGIGALRTPKQLVLAPLSQKLYWCDREGMRVMRANLDGSGVETLVQTGTAPDDAADKSRWCVGVAVDERAGLVYWTQKGPSKGGAGRIFRAPIDAATRTEHFDPARRTDDVECLFDGLPEPIDLELDVGRQLLYWTDRGDPPTGNTLNRAYVGPGMEGGRGEEEKGGGRERQVLAMRFHEAIGLALDEREGVAYVTDLAGGVYRVELPAEGGGGGQGRKEVLIAELGDVTGIALGGGS
ncbi:low-density lipoprotein receptor ywtd [Diplodia corticola]|uniref:Low-density lipoprotein receptor ywtd n=1 Tax=Diplodia corticola TaxID=236234 RepID=A0A1J9QP04_9PEZI|nr:low-density lipoprotein receptor ywtd [Diplodia corticola]OJD30638.1 low-density lipoprotein receptor ywtd [Diplodia corticola]